MSQVLTIARLTILEASRRKLLLALLQRFLCLCRLTFAYIQTSQGSARDRVLGR